FDAFPRRNQAEGQYHSPAFNSKMILVKIGIHKRHVRDTVRDDVYFLLRHAIDLTKHPSSALGHDYQAGRQAGNLLENTALVGIRLFQDGVRCGDDRDLQIAQERENMAARWSAVDAVFVLE